MAGASSGGHVPSPWHMALPSVLFAIAFSSMSPVLQELIIQLMCDELQQGENCDSKRVSSASSAWVAYVLLAAASVQLLTSGSLGSLADHPSFGRRAVYGIALAGYCAQAIVCGCIALFRHRVLAWRWRTLLLASGMLQGVGGGAPVVLMSIFAYAADCTATRAKARGPTFTILESLFGVGAVAGSFASGLLVTHIGLASTFWLAAALFGCSFLYIWTIPESLSADQPKAKSSLCKNNTITSLRVLVSPREHIRKQRWSVLLMSTTFFLLFAVYLGLRSVLVVFSKHFYGWGDTTVGYLLGVQSSSRAICAFAILPVVKPYLTTERAEIRLIQTSLLVSACCCAALGYRSQVGSFVVVGLLGGAMSMPFGFMRGFLSRSVDHTRQGLLLSGVASLEVVDGMCAPVLFNMVYDGFLSVSSGVAFFLMASLLLAGAAILLLVSTEPAASDSDKSALLPSTCSDNFPAFEQHEGSSA